MHSIFQYVLSGVNVFFHNFLLVQFLHMIEFAISTSREVINKCLYLLLHFVRNIV